MLKRKLWKKDSGFKNSITSGEFGNSFNLLRHRSWDSMTHETCTLILQCLVSCSCQKSSVVRAIQGHSGQMFLKTMLIGLSIFRCGHEKSVHGRPSCSLRLHIPNYWRFCLVVQTCFKAMLLQWVRWRVRSGSRFDAIFILDKAKALPIRIGSQTVWQDIRLDFRDNKDKMIPKDYELHDRCDFLCWPMFNTRLFDIFVVAKGVYYIHFNSLNQKIATFFNFWSGTIWERNHHQCVWYWWSAVKWIQRIQSVINIAQSGQLMQRSAT